MRTSGQASPVCWTTEVQDVLLLDGDLFLEPLGLGLQRLEQLRLGADLVKRLVGIARTAQDLGPHTNPIG